MDQASAPLTTDRPHLLWSEQNPSDWWSATHKAVAALEAKNRSKVDAIGLTGQMHGATLLDDQGDVIRPAILWNDGRSANACDRLEQAVPDLAGITGNRAMPGFTAPKLLWLRRHEPETFAKVAMVLLPKDYVRFKMTGAFASDMSDSAGTLWLDTGRRQWSETVLSACDLTPDHMPELFEGPDITGQLSVDIAQGWGMDRVPVVAGGGDNAAGAVGSGVVKKGDGFLSLGTSGVIFLANEIYRPCAEGGLHTFCHALPDRWHHMAVMLSAASAVDWVAELCGYDNPGNLHAEAEARATLSEREIFLPYLSGERTPHNNPNAQGVFFGLTHETDRAALAQAALEGVAFGLADGVDALRNAGAEIESLSVIGGGARSHYWGQILASTFDLPLIYRDSGTVGPAYGAAQIARLGLSGEAIEDVCKPPPVTHVIEPDTDKREQLALRHTKFKSLYSALETSFVEPVT